jgi:hypothetical protein
MLRIIWGRRFRLLCFPNSENPNRPESEPYSNEPWYLRKVGLKCPHGTFWDLTVGVCRIQKPLVVLPILG